MPEAQTEVLRARLIEVYNLYRTALLNRKYYAHKLALWKRWNSALEVALAIGTSGTIGAWAIWRKGAGEDVWTIFAASAALLGVIKPVIQLPKGIERYSKLYVGYSDLFYDFQAVVSDIQTTHSFSQEMGNKVANARERIKKLSLDDDPTPNKTLVKQFYGEVNTEIPSDRLWMP